MGIFKKSKQESNEDRATSRIAAFRMPTADYDAIKAFAEMYGVNVSILLRNMTKSFITKNKIKTTEGDAYEQAG